MKVYFLRKFVFIFFIFSFTILIKCDEKDECSNFTDCNKCSLCNDETKTLCKCQWTNKGCIFNTKKYSQNNENWYSKTFVCQTLDKLNNVENIYCPNSLSRKTESSLNKDNSIEYTIQPDSNGFYGKKMAICNFEFEQASHKDIMVNIEFSSKIFINPKIYIESIDSSKIITKTTIDKNENIKLVKNSKIIIKVLLRHEYTVSPIKIKLSIISSNHLLSLALTIITLLILFLVIYIIFYIIQKKEKKRKIQLENGHQAPSNMAIIMRNSNSNIFIHNRKENINLEVLNKQKLDKLFNNKMNKHFYKEEFNQYCDVCSICLNKFNEKSEVSITPCKHVFHYKCIHNWLYKTIINPNCPNCKHEILKDEEESKSNEKKEANAIIIRRRYKENNSNIRLNQLDDDNRRAVTINIYHQSVNADSSQRYRIQEN